MLIALVRNATARISATAYRDPGGEIARHRQPAGAAGAPRRPAAGAGRRSMCDWVSDALKTYHRDTTTRSRRQARPGAGRGRARRSASEPAPPKTAAGRQRAEADRQARRVRPAQGRLPDAGAAARARSICSTSPSPAAGRRSRRFRGACSTRRGPAQVALACRAVGHRPLASSPPSSTCRARPATMRPVLRPSRDGRSRRGLRQLHPGRRRWTSCKAAALDRVCFAAQSLLAWPA